MKHFRSNGGFTLIELVMVIVIMGILAAVAIPKYIGLQEDAKHSATDGVVGAVRAGVSIWHADKLIDGTDEYPDVLGDGNIAVASSTNKLFESVLEVPITSGWTKTGALAYTAPNTGTFTYNATTGVFEQ